MDDLEVAFRKPPCLIIWDVGTEMGMDVMELWWKRWRFRKRCFHFFWPWKTSFDGFFSRWTLSEMMVSDSDCFQEIPAPDPGLTWKTYPLWWFTSNGVFKKPDNHRTRCLVLHDISSNSQGIDPIFHYAFQMGAHEALWKTSKRCPSLAQDRPHLKPLLIYEYMEVS